MFTRGSEFEWENCLEANNKWSALGALLTLARSAMFTMSSEFEQEQCFGSTQEVLPTRVRLRYGVEANEV
jgi:hypothetical protein